MRDFTQQEIDAIRVGKKTQCRIPLAVTLEFKAIFPLPGREYEICIGPNLVEPYLITGVSIQRLQDVTHLDCVQEGWPGQDISQFTQDQDNTGVTKGNWIEATGDGDDACIEWFADEWEKRYGKGTWDENPYVWRIVFKKIENA